MVRRSLLIVLLALAARGAAASCPESAPTEGMAVELLTRPYLPWSSAWRPSSFAVAGEIMSLRAIWTLPCIQCFQGPWPYAIQPCDKVTWRFGDGTVVETTGNVVEHTFQDPANVTVSLTIENALGRAEIKKRVIIAGSSAGPASLQTWGREYYVVNESNRVVNIPVRRIGDTTTWVSAVYTVSSVWERTQGAVEFPPGVIDAWIPVVVKDDPYSSRARRQFVSVVFSNPAGGLLLPDGYFTRFDGMGSNYIAVEVLDDEPYPIASFQDVEVVESAGVARVPFALNVPLAEASMFDVVMYGSAKEGKDYIASRRLTLPEGQAHGFLEIPIIDDGAPEPRKELVVSISAYGGNFTDFPQFTKRWFTVTIVDDDGPSRRRSASH